MPARRRTGGPPSVASTNSDDPEDAYKLKRQKNNDSVKKTRAKSKEEAQKRIKNVQDLRMENTKLQTQIDEKKKNVAYLKELLLNNVKTEERELVIQNILDERSDDDEDNDYNNTTTTAGARPT